MQDVVKIKKEINKKSNKRKRRKTFKQVLKRKMLKSILLTVFFSLIVIILGVIIIFSSFISKVQLKGNEIAYKFGYSAATIISGSMEPTIHVGDIVLIKKTDKVGYNDIITFFAEDGESYTHRIVAVGKDGKYRTKGDANNTVDDFYAYNENILGVVRFKIPYIGKYLDLLASKVSKYFIMMLLILTVIMVIVELIDFIKILKFEKRFTDEEAKILKEQKFEKRLRKMQLKILMYRIGKTMKLKKV